MGKYDDAIGGGKIIVDVEEILNEEAASKVDKKIKSQKQKLEEPVEIKVDVDSSAIKKLDKLTKAVRENRKALKNAISSGSNIDEVSNLVNTHKQLEKQIKAVTKQVKGNSKEVSASKRALTDAKKLIDQLSVSTTKVDGDNISAPITNVEKSVKKAVTSVSKFQKVLTDLTKKYGNESFTNIFGDVIASFASIDESNALQVYDALIAKDKEYQAQLEKEAQLREKVSKEIQEFANATKHIQQGGQLSQDVLKSYTHYWEQISSGAMSAADAITAFKAEWQELGGAVDNSQKKQIDEIRMLVKNQKDWLKYLDQSLNPDKYKADSKRDAAKQLRDLTNSMQNRSRNNYANDPGQYAREMAEVAWVQGYKEAERLGVAQSTLSKYYSSSAMMNYDNNIKTLQDEYDMRQKLLSQHQEELDRITQVTNAVQKQTLAVEDSGEVKKQITEVQDNASKIVQETKAFKEKAKVIAELADTTEQLAKSQERYMYHAGKFRDNGRKGESFGVSGPDRGTGFYGTGTYGVDLQHIKEVAGQHSGYRDRPLSIIDTSKYNLYDAVDSQVADSLHAFLKDFTKKTYGVKGSKKINTLYSDFKKLFPDNDVVTSYDAFKGIVDEITSYVTQNKNNYPAYYDIDSAPTVLMKRLGYEGINTLGGANANTEYGTVIYDLKEESIICKEITDELQRQQILEGKIGEVIASNVSNRKASAAIEKQSNVVADAVTAQETAKAKLDQIKRQAYNYRRNAGSDDVVAKRETKLSGSLGEIEAIRTEFPTLEKACVATEKAIADTLSSLQKSVNSADEQTDKTAELLNVEKQITEEKQNQNNLVAIHGLSLANLKEAVEKGGFPAPSVALTDPDVYSGGYGEATVVFKKSAVDPSANPANKVYGVDAYTATYPSFGYELNEDELIKASEKTGLAIEELRLACDRAHQNLTDAVATVGFSSNISEELQDIYLKKRGITIETRNVDDDVQNSFHRFEDLFNNGVRDFITRDGITFDAIVNDEKTQNEYITALRKYADDFNKANAEAIESFPQFAIKESNISQIIDVLKLARTDPKLYEDEKVSFEHDQAVVRGAMKVLDVADYNSKKSELISENRSDYKQFVQDLISDILVKPNVRGSKGQRFDNTPEGIAAAISSYGGKNALYDEDPFMRSTMDTHEFIIAASKTYNNMAEIISDMARLQKDADGTHTPLQSKYDPQAIAGVIASENNVDAREVWAKMLKAVDGNYTAESIGKALRDSGLTVDDSTVSHIAELADEARTVSTRYFEGKPQRALGIDEIDFVSLPSDFAQTPEMKEMLSGLGIKVVEHISGDMESRAKALKDGMQAFGEADSIPKLVDGIKDIEASAESAAVANQKLAQTNDNTDVAVEQEKLAQANQEVGASAEKAAKQIGEQADALKEQSAIENVQGTSVASKNITASEYKALFGDGSVDALLKDFGISGDSADKVASAVTELAKLTTRQLEDTQDTSIDDQVNATIQKLITEIASSSSMVVGSNESLQEFYNYMKGTKIRHRGQYNAEFGDDWKSVQSRFRNVLTKGTNGTPVDALYEEAMGLFPDLFDSNIVNPADQLKAILNRLQQARDAKKNGFKITEAVPIEAIEESVTGLYVDIFNKVSSMNSISDALLDNEKQIGAAIADANEERKEALQLEGQTAASAQEQSAAHADVSVEELIEHDINSAIEKLRTARDNETTLFNLKGAFSGDDLVSEARSFVEKIANESDLSVGQFKAKDDLIQVQLYNDALKVTVDQTYRLRQATEETDASLELVSQSFKQNVKALNANNFDVDGIRARALASVEKVRSSLHGLEYDLSGLEDAAKNITSEDDFKKFNNQLQATQDSIQAIKNTTISKNSMNPLANMQRDMQNANIDLDTMRLKLQKIGDIDGIADAEKTIESMRQAVEEFNNASDATTQQGAYNKYSNLRSTFDAQLKNLNAAKAANKSKKSLTPGTNAAEKAISALDEIIARLQLIKNTDVDVNVDDSYNRLIAYKQELTAKLNAVGSSTDAESQVVLKNMAAAAQASVKEVAKLEQQWIKTQAAVENGDLNKIGVLDQSGDVYTQMLEKIKVNADGATISNVKFDNTTNTLTYTLKDASGAVSEMVANLDKYTGTVVTGMQKTGHLKTAWQDLGSSIGGIGKQLVGYAANMLQVMDFVRYLRQGFEAVKEIDAALTELKKVTDETEASYRKFLNTASQTAGQIGSTVSDFTEATSNFARLGYTMEESADMAKTAIVYKNVADGLDTVEESTDSIISTMKAFGIESNDTMSIVDRFNEVGNNFAITSAGIGEALQRSASALFESGNTIDESIALVTAANSVIQNPEQVGELFAHQHSNMLLVNSYIG